MKKTLRYWCCLCVILIIAGCGYQLIGTNPPLPENATTLHLLNVENNTFQAGLDTRLVRNLKKLLRENTSVRLANSPSSADLLLRIHLNELTTEQTSVTSDGVTIELKLGLIGFVSLENRRTQSTVWEERTLNAESLLFYEKDEQESGLTVFTLNRGMEAATNAFAEKVYERIFFNF